MIIIQPKHRCHLQTTWNDEARVPLKILKRKQLTQSLASSFPFDECWHNTFGTFNDLNLLDSSNYSHLKLSTWITTRSSIKDASIFFVGCLLNFFLFNFHRTITKLCLSPISGLKFSGLISSMWNWTILWRKLLWQIKSNQSYCLLKFAVLSTHFLFLFLLPMRSSEINQSWWFSYKISLCKCEVLKKLIGLTCLAFLEKTTKGVKIKRESKSKTEKKLIAKLSFIWFLRVYAKKNILGW